MYCIMSSVTSDDFTFSFPILMSLICFPFLVAMARTSNTMLNKGDESGHSWPCARIWQEGFQIWVLYWLWVCCEWLLLCWDMFSLYPFWQDFCHEWMLNLIKCFFCIYGDSPMAFVFPFADVVYRTDWFAYVEKS